MTTIALMCAGAALGLGLLVLVAALAQHFQPRVDIGPRPTIIPPVDIRC